MIITYDDGYIIIYKFELINKSTKDQRDIDIKFEKFHSFKLKKLLKNI